MINQQTNSMTMSFIYAPTLTNTEWLETLATETEAGAPEAYTKLLDLVNNEGFPLDDIRDFMDAYGYEAFLAGHYETWANLTDGGYDMGAIEAFVEEFGIGSIDGFEDSYCGTYRDGAEYARELVEGGWDLDNIPSFVEIDWEATWENLSQDYTEVDGHIFNNNW